MQLVLNALLYIAIALGAAIALIIVAALLQLLRGYLFYRRHGGKKRLFARIEEIRSDKNFTKLDETSNAFRLCVVTMEDGDFFLHKGINYKMLKKSIKYNLKHHKMYLGGSSITQQLAKNLLFPFKKVLKRKIGEVFAVRHLENNFSKSEILELYINCIEYGENCYGIKNAADFYLKKEPKYITFSEAVQLTSLLPAPKLYAPDKNNELFLKSRSNTLNALEHKGVIRKEDALEILGQAPFESGLSEKTEQAYEHISYIALRSGIPLEKPNLIDFLPFREIFEQ